MSSSPTVRVPESSKTPVDASPPEPEQEKKSEEAKSKKKPSSQQRDSNATNRANDEEEDDSDSPTRVNWPPWVKRIGTFLLDNWPLLILVAILLVIILPFIIIFICLPICAILFAPIFVLAWINDTFYFPEYREARRKKREIRKQNLAKVYDPKVK